MNKQDEQILTIKKIFPDATAVYEPKFCGIAHDIYITENHGEKIVCRFTKEITAKHNIFAGQQLQSIGITVPDISIHNCDGQYVETYPFINGKTFHERIMEGMPTEKQDAIYQELFNISYKISQIPYDKQFELPLPLVLKSTSILFKLFGVKQKKIYHTDIHTKNVILDEHDNIRALIDLDAVYPEYFSVVLIHLIRDAKKHGYDIEKLKPYYQLMGDQDCPIGLEKQMKIYSALQKTFRFFVNDFTYKQLLKIRIK